MIAYCLKFYSQFRSWVLLFIYTCCLSVSYFLSFYIRFDFSIAESVYTEMWRNASWIIVIQLALLFYFKQFRGLLTFFRIPDACRIVASMGLSSIIILSVVLTSGMEHSISRGIILMDFVLGTLSIGSFRLAIRVLRERYSGEIVSDGVCKDVIIVGATNVGAALVADLLSRSSNGLRPVGFLDDSSNRQGNEIHGIRVLGRLDELINICMTLEVRNVIIALPYRSLKKIQGLIELSRRNGIGVEIIPSMEDLATGQVRASRIRPVEIEDVLGREPVLLDSEEIGDFIKGRVILVTGAGGSIGSELCRQLVSKDPHRVILVDSSEGGLFMIEHELVEAGYGGRIQAVVGNILDETHMREVFDAYMPDVVFHAAAHKHVTMMERQPREAIENNVIGTRLLGQIAMDNGVGHFIFISTDKAINPSSVMGATKRMAEKVVLNYQSQNMGTRFMCVRFGNVMGASGSVIPIFKKQIQKGGPVAVTHKDVTRYFMTVQEAVGLVLQCTILGEGGEVFVLDMGDPVKIIDVACKLIELSGYVPHEDIEIRYIGLRPGEKLFEELQHSREALLSTSHPRVQILKDIRCSYEEVPREVADLLSHLELEDSISLKKRLERCVSEYSPYLGELDSVVTSN